MSPYFFADIFVDNVDNFVDNLNLCVFQGIRNVDNFVNEKFHFLDLPAPDSSFCALFLTGNFVYKSNIRLFALYTNCI